MKKNLLLLLGIGAMGYLPASAQFTVTNLNFPIQHADISLVDIDGDGDMDIAVTGEDGSGVRKLQVFKNNGTGTFTAAASPFTPVTRATIDWNDINGDGKLDMIMNGFSPSAPIDSVYTSDGVGNFTSATSIALPQITPSTGFADLNNDGYTDIYVFGNIDIAGGVKPKIFFNNKAGGFTQASPFDAFEFIDSDVTVIDYDNDKDLDIFVDAYERISNSRFSKMFVNNGSGSFTVQDLGLIQKGYGSAVWGDYNSDGFLDLLLNGDGGANGEGSNDIYRLYRNVAGVFTAVTTFEPYRQISTGDGGRFVDWDNDGDLDIVVTGYNGAEGRQATAIFLNTAGTFSALSTNATLPGVSESSIEVADIDGDSDLDLFLTGYSGNNFNGAGSAYNSHVTLLIRNPATTVNAAPTAPGGLIASGNQAAVTLSWNPATDLTTLATALSYNLFLVNTSTGKWLYYPLADTTTGKLALQRLGNVNLNRSWIIKGLPAGNYRWGVQAVDNSFMGSTFSKSTFTINADGTLPVSLASFTVAAEGNKAKIAWSTASEQNNDRFEIERSADGTRFTPFGTVKANGTTTSVSQYSVYDYTPLKGMNYYRLVQYNKDGRQTIYGVRTANFKTGGIITLSVYPNPVVKDFGVRIMNYEGKSVTATLTDLMGKLVHKEVIQIAAGQIDYSLNLNQKPASGNYILQVTGEGIKESVKVVVK